MGETPFALNFRTEVVIPMEISISSFKIQHCDISSNRDELRINLDLLEGLREEASIRIAVQQRKAAYYFDQKVKPRPLSMGDWVLQNLKATGK